MRMSVEHLDRRVHRVHSKKISQARRDLFIVILFIVFISMAFALWSALNPFLCRPCALYALYEGHRAKPGSGAMRSESAERLSTHESSFYKQISKTWRHVICVCNLCKFPLHNLP